MLVCLWEPTVRWFDSDKDKVRKYASLQFGGSYGVLSPQVLPTCLPAINMLRIGKQFN